MPPVPNGLYFPWDMDDMVSQKVCEIENVLKEHLNLEKIIWIKDGIDPDETNGHVDDVACFIRPARSSASGEMM